MAKSPHRLCGSTRESHVLAVDAHSKWLEVAVMKSTSSEKTIEELRSIFSRFGLPQRLVSDNGPQLVSEEFRIFMEENGIKHIKSAPYHPATNRLAERFVKTMKQALRSSKCTQSLNRRLSAFLLSYRNTSCYGKSVPCLSYVQETTLHLTQPTET